MPGSIDYPPKNDDVEGTAERGSRVEELRARIAEAEKAAKKDGSKEGELLALEDQLRSLEHEASGAETPPPAAAEPEVAAPSPEAPSTVSSEGPASLVVDDLVKMSKGGDLAGFVDALDANHDAWSKYASEHNVFSSPSVRALWQARSKAVHAAQELEKASAPAEQQAAEQKLRASLEEMNGPLSMNVQTAVEENEKRLKGYAEGTHAEHRQTIEQTVLELTKLTEGMQPGAASPEKPANVKVSAAENAVKPEKGAMDAAEKAYLDAYKAYYAQKGAKQSGEPEELRVLKTAYDESRLAYGNALTKSAQQRLEAKGTSGDAAEKNKRVLERYNRLVRYNEIIKPAAQKRYRAKLEAMDSRERSAFTKAFEWTARQNQKLEKRFGKWGARGIRALATTAIAGAFVGTGGGIAALLGWGAVRVGKSLARTTVTAGAVEAAGNIRGYFARKTQAEAQHHLDYVGRTSTALTLDDLEQYDLHRQGLEKDADDLTVQKKEVFARIAAAAGIGGVGAGVAAFEMLSHLPSIEHVASAPPAEPEAPAVHPEAAPTPAPAPEHAAPAAGHHAPAGPPHAHLQEAPSSGKSPLTAPVHTEAPPAPPAPEAHAAAVPAAEAPAPEAPSVPGYAGPFNTVIPLPQGMDPNSPEAVAWLNRTYNPTVDFSHAPAAAMPQAAEAPAPIAEPPHAIEPSHAAPEAPVPSAPEQPLAPEAAAPVEQAAPVPVPAPGQPPETIAAVPAPEHAGVSQPASAPLESVAAPAPETAPVAASELAPLDTPPPPAATPLDHAAAPVAVPTAEPPSAPEAPAASAVQPEIAPASLLNPNGFDLSVNHVGLDSRGNLFAHVTPTGTMQGDNDAAYATALEYSQTHPGKPVYYVWESRSPILGSLKREVLALRYAPNEGDTIPQPYTEHSGWVATAPTPPSDAELTNPQ